MVKANRRDKRIQNEARKLAASTDLKYSEALKQLRINYKDTKTQQVKANLMTDSNDLVAASEPRVQRSPLVESGEVFTLNSWDTADGKTRILMPMDTTDAEFAAAEEAIRESDEQLESLRKIHEYVESFESDEDVIARCKLVTDNPDELDMAPLEVAYKVRNDVPDDYSAALISTSGEGIDSIHGWPVVLRWFDEVDEWRQVDPWKWEPEAVDGEFVRVMS